MKSVVGRVGAIWGVGGILALLASAIWRLGRIAAEAMAPGLEPLEWVGLLAFAAFMVHAEGIRGFQKAFSPRVAARARHLAGHPRPWHVLLAPLFCMAFFHATRKRRIVAWSLAGAILPLIWLFGHLEQPLRGILDAGVVAGLSWGLVTVLVFALRAALEEDFSHDPALPES